MDFLKEVFGEEALTYDGLAEKLKDNTAVKLGNLASGSYVGQEKFKALELERDGLKGQLSTANETIKGFEGIDVDGLKTKIGEWETKYNTDTANLTQQLEAQKYSELVKDSVSSLKFSSEAAKRAFISDLTNKALPNQDGKLLGFEDFVKAYKESDVTAFAVEGQKVPVVVGGGSGGEIPSNQTDILRKAMGLTKKE